MVSAITVSAPEHPIKSVTVFASYKAEVVRIFTLDLKAVQNKIEIKSLPSAIDTDSVRVSGPGYARLFDIVCTAGNANIASYDPDSPSETIRILKAKILTLECEKRVREHEAELLVNYAKTLNGEHVTALDEKMIQVHHQIKREGGKTAFKKGTTRGNVTIILGTDVSCTVDLKLTYIVSNVNWRPTYELHATTENGKPSSSVALHYRARVFQTTGEDWTNTALTLSTVSSDTVAKRIPELTSIKIRPQPAVSYRKDGLVGNGGVGSQPPWQIGTGRTVMLRSGSSTSQTQTQQTLQPFSYAQQPQQPQGNLNAANQAQLALISQHQRQQAQTSASSFKPSSTSGLFGASFGEGQGIQGPTTQTSAPPIMDNQGFQAYEAIAAPGAITEPTTVVAETPIAISYSVHGESTMPTDGLERQVSVAVLPFEANISYVAIPRIEPRVYLQCQVKNTSEYRLLPGQVSVILDDSYVSKTSINDVNTGDNFDCTLGDDAATKVTYSRSSRTVKATGSSFSEAMNTTMFTTKISIHNKHQFSIPHLVVRDIIPTCDDKRAKVVLRKPEGLADAKDGQVVRVNAEGLKVMWEKLVDGKGGEKDGKFEWNWSVGNGAKVMLEAQWELKAPADIIWVES